MGSNDERADQMAATRRTQISLQAVAGLSACHGTALHLWDQGIGHGIFFCLEDFFHSRDFFMASVERNAPRLGHHM